MGKLDGKVIVVTGGGQGLGLTSAEAFLREGAQVSVWDVRGDRLGTAEAELKAQGFKPDLREVDTSRLADLESAYKAMVAAIGEPDALLNNAALKNDFMGRPRRDSEEWRPGFWELDPDKWRRVVEVNCVGTYNCSRVVAPDMVRRRSGSILVVSTSPRTRLSPWHQPYGSTKSFLESFVQSSAPQLSRYGVRINAVLPGGHVDLRGNEHHPDARAYDVMVPLQVYLASDESKDVTGQILCGEEFNGGPPAA